MRLLHIATAAFALTFAPIALNAQNDENKLLDLRAEARVDFQRKYIDGENMKDDTGFKGKFVNLIAKGNVADNVSYAYRQRLIKPNNDQTFFQSIDFIYMKWQADEHWAFSAGKQIVGVGGYEYDRAPIDLYLCSEYWNGFECYELGASAEYTFKGGNDKILAQVCQSPFRANSGDMYAYNLAWYGQHGCLGTTYSLNMMEYMPGKYISYIALGHKLSLGNFNIELDLMNRASDHQTYFFKDCSVIADIGYRPIPNLNIFGKVSYDVNKTNHLADYSVMPGTEITYLGGGAEYFPLKNSNDIRLHLVYGRGFGKNGNPEGGISDKQDFLTLGLTWRVNLLALKR